MSEKLFHLTISTHHFKLSRLTARGRDIANNFSRRSIQFGLTRIHGAKYVMAPIRVFGATIKDRSEFRFHINQLAEFKQFLKENFIIESIFTEEVKSVPLGIKIQLEVKDNWVAKEEQLPVIAYMESDEPYRSRFVDLQTGKGKTFCALQAISTYGKRTVIVIKPMYIDKWCADVLKTYNISIKDVMVVKGSDHLKGLIQIAQEGSLKSKFIIISNKTLQNWYSLYEDFGTDILDMGYDCLPENLFEVLGAGMRLIDEVHQDFHFNFKLDLYTNVERSISLSATLLNNDAFLTKMYKVAYPIAERYSGTPLDKYVTAREVCYNLRVPNAVRTNEFGSTVYSHHAFERSILRNPLIKNSYFKMIWNTIEISYIQNYKPGQKCAIFCSSIDFCTQLTGYLSNLYKDKSVKRYVEDDPYENLLESDMVITTILSGGTAHDIPNLSTVILTVAIDSIQANIQTLGRLRKLPDAETHFLYFTCQDIPKHVTYGERKRQMLNERAASYQMINAPFLI